MSIRIVTNNLDGARIKVLGVGGGGGNALNTMVEKGIDGVEFIAINTDAQALDMSKAHVKIQIGKTLTKGLGAGMRDDIGLKAVEENREDISRGLENCDMVFITAGFGGGTGTGAAPEIAHIAKTCGCLVVAIVTKPFHFEGQPRMQLAEQGLKRLKEEVDSLIVIPNERILNLISKDTTMRQAFELADRVLYNATRGISQIITKPGEINVDFNDIKTVMENMGDAMIGTGIATGEDRAEKAARSALENPLLEEIDISDSKSVLVNISSNGQITMNEVEVINQLIKERTNESAKYIMGILEDENMKDEVMVTVIATGFNKAAEDKGRQSIITELGKTEFDNVNWGNKITKVPETAQQLKEYDIPAYQRRAEFDKKLSINDDMSEKFKVPAKTDMDKIGLEDFDVEEYTPSFLRRSND